MRHDPDGTAGRNLSMVVSDQTDHRTAVVTAEPPTSQNCWAAAKSRKVRNMEPGRLDRPPVRDKYGFLAGFYSQCLFIFAVSASIARLSASASN